MCDKNFEHAIKEKKSHQISQKLVKIFILIEMQGL
jgi:hypothetical protein